MQAPEGSGEQRDGGRGLLQGREAAQLRLTPQASFGRSRAARGAALGLAVCVGQGERRLLLGSRAEGPALSSSLLISSLAPSCSQSDPGSQIGRAVTAGCWQPQELTPLWASMPPHFPRHFGGKAAGWLLIGPAGRRGGRRGREGGRVRLFSISVFSPLSLSFPPSFLFFFFSLCLLPPIARSLRM